MNDTKEMSFEELAALEMGTVLATVNHPFLPIYGQVIRGPVALCAYIGFPKWHPLAGIGYDDIPMEVHGGLTYSQAGDGEYHPESAYWIGWDYAHAGDRCFYDLKYHDIKPYETERLVPEVLDDLQVALKEFTPLFLYGWFSVWFRLKLRRMSYK